MLAPETVIVVFNQIRSREQRVGVEAPRPGNSPEQDIEEAPRAGAGDFRRGAAGNF
jgi:hypothetical protein